MVRTLGILFRRDPSRDRTEGGIHLEGYRMCQPDGTPVSSGVDALCSQGQRLLGLGTLLAGRQERYLELLSFPQETGRENMTRLPGRRVRRFYVERSGSRARLYFMDGTPTAIWFDLEQDDEPLLSLVGLIGLPDGERSWFDLAARPLHEDGDPCVEVASTVGAYRESAAV